MSRSIQSRLTLALTAIAIVLSAGVGTLLYLVLRAEMVRNFDRGLKSKGDAVVSLVSLEAGGILDFEFNEAAMPEYRPGTKAEYFQIRFANGTAYARAKSLGEADLWFGRPDTAENDSFHDLPLPDGRPGRAVRIAFVPQSVQPPPSPADPMVAVIARDRGDLDDNLRHLLQSLTGATVLLGATTALTSLWVVRRSLRPLRRVAMQAAVIDATKLNMRLSLPELPTELVPIRDRLNDLLGRLEAAFARERRFTSDVAHELRTPIAELRSIVEIAMKWPDDTEATREALSESLAISIQMHTLVNTLLSLVRATHNRTQIALQPISLSSFVDEAVAKLRGVTPLREIELSIPSEAVIDADPALFVSVLNNLLLNASEYSDSEKPVRCSACINADRVHITVENQATNLTVEDLPHVFEPFWRKDRSRTDATHAGLGLSLVSAYCGLMGIEVTATLDQATLKLSMVCARANLNTRVSSHRSLSVA